MPGPSLRLDQPTMNQRTPRVLRHLPSAWTRQLWGIYLADALTKNKDIGSLPHSPIPTIRTHSISLHDLLTTATPPNAWKWRGPDSKPPLGPLCSMISHHCALAYRSDRDHLRSLRGAPPIWSSNDQSVGAATWFPGTQPLRKRVHALRLSGIYAGTEKIGR